MNFLQVERKRRGAEQPYGWSSKQLATVHHHDHGMCFHGAVKGNPPRLLVHYPAAPMSTLNDHSADQKCLLIRLMSSKPIADCCTDLMFYPANADTALSLGIKT